MYTNIHRGRLAISCLSCILHFTTESGYDNSLENGRRLKMKNNNLKSNLHQILLCPYVLPLVTYCYLHGSFSIGRPPYTFHITPTLPHNRLKQNMDAIDTTVFVILLCVGLFPSTGYSEPNVRHNASLSTSETPSTTQVPTTEVQAKAPVFTDPRILKRTFRAWPESHSIRLKCKATGAQPLKYTWLKDGKKIPKRRKGEYLDSSFWYLKLIDLEPDDSGKYTCIVSNPYGRINHTYTLQVVSRPRFRPILQNDLPKNTTVQIGNNATMACIVLVSGTLPDFRWLKWSKTTTSKPKSYDDILNGSFRLIDPYYYKTILVKGNYGVEVNIINVTEDDFGLYTCLVSNHIGNHFRSAFLINGKVSASVKVTAPRIGMAPVSSTENTTGTALTAGVLANRNRRPMFDSSDKVTLAAIPLCGALIIAAMMAWFFWQKRKLKAGAPARPLMMDEIEHSGHPRKPHNEYVFLPQH